VIFHSYVSLPEGINIECTPLPDYWKNDEQVRDVLFG
jgi:hypothetical protein